MSRARDLSRFANQQAISVDSSLNVGINSTSPDAKLDVVGIVSATEFYGDGSNLTGVSSPGLGTALSDDTTSPLNSIYFTNANLSVASTITVNPPSSASAAFTQYANIVLQNDADLIVADGDTFIPDILGIGTDVDEPGTLAGGAGKLRVDNITNKAGTGSPNFPFGMSVAGVMTATSFSGSGANLTNINSTSATGDFSIADKIVHTGDTNTAIRFPAADTFTLETAGSERLRIASDGKITTGAVNVSYGGTIGIGKSFFINNWGGIYNGVRYEFNTSSVDNYTQGYHCYSHNGSLLQGRRYSNNDGGVIIQLMKSGDNYGDGLVTQGDTIGQILFQPNNGAGFTNGATIEGAVDDNTGDTISLSVIPTKFKFNLRDSVGNSDRIYFTANNDFNWGEVGQGHTQGTIHLLPKTSTAHSGGAITWGAEDDGYSFPYSGGERAHAGIYVRSDGTYGTKMYLSTTDQYSAGSKTAIEIDHQGVVHTKKQPFIYGRPTNTTGSGIFNAMGSIQSRGGLAFTTDRITVSKEGVYLITFNTICDTSTGRVDARIRVNGSTIVNTLNENNGTGYHYRGASICRYLYENDYIQVENGDWYDPSNSATDWKTLSVAFLG